MNKHIILTAAISAMASTAVMAEEAATIDALCARSDIECLKSDKGMVIGRPGTTAPYTGSIDAAAAKFEHVFGMPAPEAAIILGEVNNSDIRQSLPALFPVALPWMTLEDRKKIVARQVRAQIRQQRPDMPDEILEATVKRSVEASLQANGRNDDAHMHEGILSHELGHMYFMRTYWPDGRHNLMNPAAGDHTQTGAGLPQEYASPAPDWLDEMAAVLLENTALTTSRYESLQAIKSAADLDKIWSLSDYFTLTHPALDQAREALERRQQSSDGNTMGGVVILSQSDLEKPAKGPEPVMFYAQSRAFADYMIEKSGNEQIFAVIAAQLTKGGTMADWLQSVGASHGLPQTVAALQNDFNRWLMNRLSLSE